VIVAYLVNLDERPPRSYMIVLISNNFQQALYSFDTPGNSQEARAAAIQGSSQ